MKITSKGQAAMEYLMTYGWAILVVVAVVAALYGLGVFKIGSGSVKCSPCFSYFAYVDNTANSVVLKNGPTKISVTSITPSSSGPSLPASLDPGATLTITLSSALTAATAFDIGYTVTDSGLSHNDTASLRP